MTPYRKKLIEVALPLEAINAASAREKSIRHGHPSTLHLWWARRPLAACRAVLFGQLVDDPSSWPSLWPTEEEQEVERQRLFRLIEELVLWENSNNETVINAARLEIARSLARGRKADGQVDARDDAVLVNRPKPVDVNRFLAEVAPPVHDPFAGGGSIPLEAQRLGLRAIATDLNPVAVLINKALIEIPPKFAGQPAVNPESRRLRRQDWKGAQGLAEDVRYYGKWMRDEALKRIGHLYPEVELPKEQGGGKATVIAWLWARTVASPNPACGGAHVPLVSSFWLSKKPGREAWVEPIVDRANNTWRFEARPGKPPNEEKASLGTRAGKAQDFLCLLSGEPVARSYVRDEGKAARLGVRLLGVVADGPKGRVYSSATPEAEALAESATKLSEYHDAQSGFLDGSLPNRAMITGGVCSAYGLDTWAKLFSPRQTVAIVTLSSLVQEVVSKVQADIATLRGTSDAAGMEYGRAIGLYLAFMVDQVANHSSTLCGWNTPNTQMRAVFARQGFVMTWDYAESNPFSSSTGSFANLFERMVKGFELLGYGTAATVNPMDARHLSTEGIYSTDPPYYDNIAYAELSDFFYPWLRRTLRSSFPDVFRTVQTPKADELVYAPSRHDGNAELAKDFFESGMLKVFAAISSRMTAEVPTTVYYAFKQTESEDDSDSTGTTDGTAAISSTGWETMLASLVAAGLAVDGTWPIRTEKQGRSVGIATNALASSIVLVCRKRPADAPTITRTEFRRQLRTELPAALKALQHGNIAPVDMAQASIGPGMAIFSRHSKVLEADGMAMSVRTALQIINQALDEYLTEQEGEFDPDTRFAVTWFETRAFDQGAFGEAETLAKARNVSVQAVAEAGLLYAAAGKVRLLRREEMPDDYSPLKDKTPTVWEAVQHLIKRLDQKGEQAAADLLAELGSLAPPARDLAYRLYQVCERKGWAEEARAYNGLVVAWGEVDKLASQAKTTRPVPVQGRLL